MSVKIGAGVARLTGVEVAPLPEAHSERPSKPRRERLGALTGLRFIAAMQVVAFHFAHERVKDAPLLARNLIGSGYTGVSLFFVLSGFILAYNYLDGSHDGRVDARSFWVARFARIYPVYALGLVISLPFVIQHYREAVVGGALHSWPLVGTTTLLLLQSWIPAAATVWNGPGWSLSVEAFFYLCFPLAAMLVRRTPVSRIVMVAAGCWLLALSAPLVHALVDSAGPGGSSGVENLQSAFLKYNPLLHLPEFLIGMLAAKLFLTLGTHNARFVQVLRRSPALSAIAIIAVLCNSDKVPLILLHNGLLAPLYGILIVGLSYGYGPVARFLSNPLAVLLGEASYATYVLHVPLALTLRRVLGAVGVGTHGVMLPLLYTLVILVVPVAVLTIFERPARRVIRGRFTPRPAPPLSSIP